MIEDTSFVVDLLRGDPDAATRLDLLERERVPEKVSAVTVLELHEGVRRSETPRAERTSILEILETKTVVDADREVMREAGRLSGELNARGEPIEREDCIVAATALSEDEPVVTRNVDHFERVPDVEVRSY